jgi:hypothetical protein
MWGSLPPATTAEVAGDMRTDIFVYIIKSQGD